jgi:hypothetical protein
MQLFWTLKILKVFERFQLDIAGSGYENQKNVFTSRISGEKRRVKYTRQRKTREPPGL